MVDMCDGRSRISPWALVCCVYNACHLFVNVRTIAFKILGIRVTLVKIVGAHFRGAFPLSFPLFAHTP